MLPQVLMRTQYSQKGFTLVELIVVITILAILGTIGFLAVQGYALKSRDSKRITDLGNLSRAITLRATETLSVYTVDRIPGSELNTPSLAGVNAISGVEYAAGKPNYTLLWVSPTTFLDPLGNDYRLWVSVKVGTFSLAATLENEWPTAYVSGTYLPRDANRIISIIGSTGGKAVTVTGERWLFQKFDTIRLENPTSSLNTIVSVSPDGGTIILSDPLTANSTEIFIAQSESSGLVASTTDTNTPVIGNGVHIPY